MRYARFLTLLLLLAMPSEFVSAQEVPEFEKWRDCSIDAECVYVQTPCGTPDAVSQKYATEHRAWSAEAATLVECVSPSCCFSLAFSEAMKAPGQGPRCCNGKCAFIIGARTAESLPKECGICGKVEACRKPV